jgi:hypothetical protein
VPEHTAKLMEMIEVATANGDEERENHDVEKVTDRRPQPSMIGFKRTGRLGSEPIRAVLRYQLLYFFTLIHEICN